MSSSSTDKYNVWKGSTLHRTVNVLVARLVAYDVWVLVPFNAIDADRICTW